MQNIPLGPFDLFEPVGRGGMGVVWRGAHRESGLSVAVKVLTRQALREGSAPPGFANEVRAVAALDHPGIVWVFDVGEVSEAAAAAGEGMLEEGSPYLAMEYASGGTLAEFTPRSWSSVLELLLGLLDALGHAHARQVIHRDLKPGNVLFSSASDVRPGWKLTDFGIAAALEETVDRSIARGIVGTLAYMSPEQIRSDWREFGPWTDLYALGCLVYRIVGNQRPFRDMRGPALIAAHLQQRPQKLVPRVPVPAGFAEWVDVLLQKNVHDRFQSAAEAARVLQALGGVDASSELTPIALVGSRLEDPTLDTEAPTDVVKARHGLQLSGVLPTDWRRTEVPWPPPRLVGAGLGLFGLRSIPFVGRSKERDALWQVLVDVVRPSVEAAGARRRARLVVVRGPAGVGKTRVARWLGETAHSLGGLPYLVGEARSGEPPGEALIRPFRRFFRTVRLEDDARYERLRRSLPAGQETLARTLSALLAPSGEAHGLSIEGEGRHVVVRRTLGLLGGPLRPVLLMLDDAHASIDAFHFARHVLDAQEAETTPMVVVLVLTDESLPEAAARELEELIARPETLVVPLGPMLPPDHERLVQGILALERTLGAQLAERTAGNPLHVVQIVRDWVASGALVKGAGGWELAPHARGVVPSMSGVWVARIEAVLGGLPPEAEIVLERAATLGTQVDEDEWQRVCDDPKGTWAAQDKVRFVPETAALRSALRARLLVAHLAVETDTGFAFLHEMLRESLLERARQAGRFGSLQRASARMLLHRSDGRRYAERIGRHLLAGDRAEKAVPQLVEAFRQRRKTAGEAVALTVLGLIETALRGASVPDGDRQWAELAVYRAETFSRLERLDDATRWSAAAEQLARGGGWRSLEARAGACRAQALVLGKDFEGADAVLAGVEGLLKEGDDGRLLGEVHAVRSHCAWAGGDRVRAKAHAVLAAQFLTDAGERSGIAEAWCLLGQAALREGSLDEATRAFERARALHVRSGATRGEAATLEGLGEVAQARGELEPARLLFEAATDRFRQVGSPRYRRTQLSLARVHLARRDWDEARRIVNEVASRAELGKHEPLEPAIHALLLAGSAGARDWVRFDAHLERMRLFAGEQGVRDPDLVGCLELAAARAEAARDADRSNAVRRLLRPPV